MPQFASKILRCLGAALAVSVAVVGSVGQAYGGSLEQAKRIHDRITGIPPSESTLVAMKMRIEADGDGVAAAELAMQNDAFYRVTLKNWVAPWTNRDQTAFVPLNDYIATVMGLVRDELDFRILLWADVAYVGSGVLPDYAIDSNAHYQALETGVSEHNTPYVLKDVLVQTRQSAIAGGTLPADATAGVLTSRAASRAFFIAGTNRAQLRFTLMNHLCRDLEQLHDTTRVPDRIRQDVSRSPGGDARVFLNGCIGCHSGLDPLAQAFAYYDFIYDADNDLTGEAGYLHYNGPGETDATTTTRVKSKYHLNSTTFPYGFETADDRWVNYWRAGTNSQLGWSSRLPGTGSGAKALGRELAHSQAFTQCQVSKVFETVCLRQPENQSDRDQLAYMVGRFTANGYRLKTVFADAADYCKGP